MNKETLKEEAERIKQETAYEEERENYIKDKYTPDLEEIEEELFARRSAQIIRMNKDIINNAIKSCNKKQTQNGIK